METIGDYLFWTSLYMAVMAVVFFIAVRRLATPSQARWFILTGLFASLLIPVFGMIPGASGNAAIVLPANVLPEVVVSATEGFEITRQEVFRVLATQKLIIMGALFVSLLLLLRMLISIIFLLSQIAGASVKHVSGCKLIPLKRDISPFSFFSYVFVPEKLMESEQLQPVIVHELGHVRKRHAADLVFIELLSVLFWFNPAVWYLRRVLKHQHEYEADQYVLQQQFDKISYQKLLVNMSILGYSFPLINSFNYPPLKNRIMMMNRSFSKLRARAMLSMLLAVPFFAAVFFMQSCTNGTEQLMQDEIIDYEAIADDVALDEKWDEDVIFKIVEQPPSFPGGMEALHAFMQEHLRYPEAAKDAGIQGTVFVSFVVRYDGSITDIEVLRGIGGGCDEEAVRVVAMMPAWEPGIQRGESVSVQFNMPVRFVLNQETQAADAETKRDSYFFLDGKLYASADLDVVMDELITPAEIESIDVLTGEYAVKNFGKEHVLRINRKAE